MAINTLDLLARKAAVLERIDESIVEKVIRFKWSSLSEAIREHRTVEDSGLGKFKLRKAVVQKKEKVTLSLISKNTLKLEVETDERKQQTLKTRLNNLYLDLEYIRSKRDEN